MSLRMLIVACCLLLVVTVSASSNQWVNTREEARKELFHAVVGSLKSWANLVYAKAAVDELELEPIATITINGQVIQITYGFLAETAMVKFIKLNLVTDFMEIDAVSAKISLLAARNLSDCQVDYNPLGNSGDEPEFLVADPLDCS